MHALLVQLGDSREYEKLSVLNEIAGYDLHDHSEILSKLKEIFQHDHSCLVRIRAAEICSTYNAYSEEVGVCLRDIYTRFADNPIIANALTKNYYVHQAREKLYSSDEAIRIEAAKALHRGHFFPDIDNALLQMSTDSSQLVRIYIAKAVLRHCQSEVQKKLAWSVIHSASKHINPIVSNAATALLEVTHKDYVKLCLHVSSGYDILNLPASKGWRVGVKLTWQSSRPNDIYPINLYLHDGKKKAVLAFSSTPQAAVTPIVADAHLFFKTGFLPIRESFPDIYRQVLDCIRDTYELRVTGFSLGATMAEVFSHQFDKIPAVTFDGPGSGSLIPMEHHHSQHIQTFLTAPTPINTTQEHVGRVSRLILAAHDDRYNPTLEKFASLTLRILLALPDSIFTAGVAAIAARLDYIAHGHAWLIQTQNWSFHQHSLKSIEMLIDEETDTFRTGTSIPMQSWPTRTSFFQPAFFSALKTLLEGRDLNTVRIYDVISSGVLPDYVTQAAHV
jgi:hypothetical protein